MTAQPTYQQYWRMRTESAFSAANPEGGYEWNIGLTGGGANGWIDLPIVRESDGLQPKTAVIYPSVASGTRSMNSALPIAGADLLELGNLEFAFYPELCDRILRLIMGSVARTPTAGAMLDTGGALALSTDPITVTPDTQSNGTEQIKFVIASTTGVSAATIEIKQGGSTLETISLNAGAASADGTYYSKGAYDGSSSNVSFTFTGFGVAGNVTITGVDYSTNVFTMGTSLVTGVIEQGGRPEAGSSNSEYMPGIILPTLQLTYDRSTPEGLLMGSVSILGERPDTQTAGTYAHDAATYYKPFAGWTCTLNTAGSPTAEIFSAQININPNNALYVVSSGDQLPANGILGEFEVTGELTGYPADNTLWNAYRNQTVQDVDFDFLTPHYVVDTTPFRLLLEMTQLTFGDYTRNRQGQGLGMTLPFRAIYNATDSGAAKLTTRCRMPT